MIEKLVNNNPDSVQGETDAGPMEIAKKVNELIEVVNKFSYPMYNVDARTGKVEIVKEEDGNN